MGSGLSKLLRNRPRNTDLPAARLAILRRDTWAKSADADTARDATDRKDSYRMLHLVVTADRKTTFPIRESKVCACSPWSYTAAATARIASIGYFQFQKSKLHATEACLCPSASRRTKAPAR